MKGVLPFLGGVMLLTAFVVACYQYAQPDYGNTTIAGHRRRVRARHRVAAARRRPAARVPAIAPAFFRGETLSRRSRGTSCSPRAASRGTVAAAAGLRPAGDRHRARSVQPSAGSHVATESEDDGEETDRR
jgi:hypothetical protein